MNQNGNNTRGLNGLLEGKASLDHQIESSLSAANQAMEILKISMAFKNDLDQAVSKFNQGIVGLNNPQKPVIEDNEPSMSEILAEYNQKKNGVK